MELPRPARRDLEVGRFSRTGARSRLRSGPVFHSASAHLPRAHSLTALTLNSTRATSGHALIQHGRAKRAITVIMLRPATRPALAATRQVRQCAARFLSSPASPDTSSSHVNNPSTTPNKTNPTSPPPNSKSSSTSSKGRKPLTAEQREFLSSALRVNQAGELAATLIYTGQTPPLVTRDPSLRPLMKHMYDQEAAHLRTFNDLIYRHRVRPTALYPLWSVMATGLGWGTAMLGKEAAMACTEAVETEIGGHYNAQIRRLLEIVNEWEAEGYEVGAEFRDLLNTLRRIRDEELEHLDHAVEHDAQKAEPHWLLTGVIRAGCRGAIWVSERV
ncbi:ubiquinone biosynthesis protein COQ7-domain-containing protein [Pseudoneurospora amorphoporcata]|uniref:5-demethoxyubiquinone hydroxylase, mitochondrial n=1 Tax=Pseudoneurospora amorphoporcata TaxID=241081 RepID=A0AAN6P1U2_9PEZI|nr:ubiquinone biosynthesis protein COQ7-domain-containing protein [Pseudoneurospora amorphoporcata]